MPYGRPRPARWSRPRTESAGASPRALDRSAAPAGAHAVDPQQDQRADDSENEAPEGESVQSRAGKHPSDPAADESANNSDDHRNDQSTGVRAGENSLCDRTCEQAEDDPGENAHRTSI